MSRLTIDAIDASSDDELFSLLGKTLEREITAPRGSAEFLAQIQGLPIGLSAMATTYELDVSLALDDLGWHFGNWHNPELAEETTRGLEELGAAEMAMVFRQAFELAQKYWSPLGSANWAEWYPGSELEEKLEPLNQRAWAILKDESMGIFKYWVDYARRNPEKVGATKD
jgi:hypothetical protein